MVQLIYLSKWFPGNCLSIGRCAIIVYPRKNGSGWQCLYRRNYWQIHFLLFIISSLYRYNRFSIFRLISSRSIFRSIVNVLFLSKNQVFVLYHTWDCCVRIFCVSGFAVFYSVIFRLFSIVLKHWNICYHLCICLPCFRISFPCIFYLFSIVFVYVICSLKFRRFRLSCFTMCAHCLYIHRFHCFSVFVLSFFPSFISSFFLFFSSCFPFILRVFVCVCFFLLRAVRFFCFSILYFNCTKQKYLYLCRLFCYFIGKRTGAASLNGLSHSLLFSFSFSMCFFWLC